jgi:hypothetical protein
MGLTSTVGILFVAAVAAGPADRPAAKQRNLPQQVRALVDQVNESHELPYNESIPAVWELVELGLPALRHGALKLMVSDDETTRRRGELILDSIVRTQLGCRDESGARYTEEFERLWKQLGGYQRDMPETERRKCHELWTAWVATVEELTPSRDPNRLRPPRVDD